MTSLVHRELAPHIRRKLTTGRDVQRIATPRQLLEREFDGISIGMRPTGHLHPGNLLVLGMAMRYAKENPRAKVHFDVMDLDFDSQSGMVFVPFSHFERSEVFINQATVAVQLLADLLGVAPDRVRITRLSQKMDQSVSGRAFSTLRETFLAMFKDPQITKALKIAITASSRGGRGWKPPISLICPECGSSTSEFATYKQHEDAFRATCFNRPCPVDQYSTVLSIGQLFNIHYLIDPIRDLMAPGRTAHVFGGDYAQPYARLRAPKYVAVAAAMEVARVFLQIEALPSLFLTPLLVDAEGRKISKSLGNGNGESRLADRLRHQIQNTLALIQKFIDGKLADSELVIRE